MDVSELISEDSGEPRVCILYRVLSGYIKVLKCDKCVHVCVCVCVIREKSPKRISPVTSRQTARLELKRWVGLLWSEVVNVLTANLRFTHG